MKVAELQDKLTELTNLGLSPYAEIEICTTEEYFRVLEVDVQAGMLIIHTDEAGE